MHTPPIAGVMSASEIQQRAASALAGFRAQRPDQSPRKTIRAATTPAPTSASLGSGALRASVAARLGLARNATNTEIFAALDREVAARSVAPAQQSAEDLLYAKYVGATAPDTAPLSPTEQALYERAWGAA
jgi:hypothetical protein